MNGAGAGVTLGGRRSDGKRVGRAAAAARPTLSHIRRREPGSRGGDATCEEAWSYEYVIGSALACTVVPGAAALLTTTGSTGHFPVPLIHCWAPM